jgi:hypothetical protein
MAQSIAQIIVSSRRDKSRSAKAAARCLHRALRVTDFISTQIEYLFSIILLNKNAL